MAQGGDEWELCKENVQPLKQGRAMSTLQEVLVQQESACNTAIQQQKQAFELEIRFYSGDDPLDVWDRYVRWAEQAFPQGGKESIVSALLERTVSLFHEEKKYYQDLRYLHLWLKFANHCSEPLDLYSYLHSQGIGTSQAMLYITWAEAYEARENHKKADSIFQEGIQHKAEPLDKLQCHHREFQARVSRQVLQGIAEGDADSENSGPLIEPEPQRSSLADLKCRGKKKVKAPIGRVGDFVKPANQVFGLQFQLPQQVQVGTRVQVFKENEPLTLIPQHQELTPQPWAAPPPARSKENEFGPKPWNSGRPSRKTQSSTVETPSILPSFKPFVEESAEQQFMTPCKINPSITSVLSARKASKEEDPLQRVQSCFQNKEETPMYCKSKVYAGLEEFSLEEIRAEIYMTKMRKKRQEDLEASIQRRNEMVKKIEEMEKLLMESENSQHSFHEVSGTGTLGEWTTSVDALTSFDVQDPAPTILPSIENHIFLPADHCINSSAGFPSLLTWNITNQQCESMKDAILEIYRYRDNQPVEKEQDRHRLVSSDTWSTAEMCDLPNKDAVTETEEPITPVIPVLSSTPFTIFDESAASESLDTRPAAPSVRHPLSVLPKALTTMTGTNDKQSGGDIAAVSPNALDGSELLNEDAIVHGAYENKSLFAIPEDTCDFASAANFASTPFHGLVPQRDGLSPDTHQLPKSNCKSSARKPLSSKNLDYEQSSFDQTACIKKLSPILEASQEDNPSSLSSASSVGASSVKNLTIVDRGDFGHILPLDIADVSGGDEEKTSDSTKAVWCTQLRKQLSEPLFDLICSSEEFHQEMDSMPLMEEQKDVTLGRDTFGLNTEVKLGEDDRLFIGMLDGIFMGNSQGVALKVCSKPVPWDFYITLQLKERLGDEFEQNFQKCSCFLYTDGCITLYQNINKLSTKEFIQDYDTRKEDLILLLAHGLISLVEKLHSVEIVHGNLRPETLFLGDRIVDSFTNNEQDSVLKLMDFSHSLDMRMQLPVISIAGFPTAQSQLGQQILSQCSSLYQVDLLGIAESIHFMMFGLPLQVQQKDSLWKLSLSIHSDWNVDMWTKLFTKLLNIEDKSTVTLLQELKDEIEQLFDSEFQFRLPMCLMELFI